METKGCESQTIANEANNKGAKREGRKKDLNGKEAVLVVIEEGAASLKGALWNARAIGHEPPCAHYNLPLNYKIIKKK